MKISEEQYQQEKKNPEKLRSCYNCEHLREALSIWCGNEKAIADRGTKIPGIIHCPYWEPDKKAHRKMQNNLTQELEKASYYTGILMVN